MIHKFKIFLIFLLLVTALSFNSSILKAETISENIKDEANIFRKELFESKLNDFFNNHNIKVFIVTVENSTQEEFENTLNKYREEVYENYILFYISTNNGNVGIYVSNSLEGTINEAVKIMMLSSMEDSFKINEFENGLIIALDNLEQILDSNKEIQSHETININPVNEKEKYISIVIMVSCFLLFISGFFFYKNK